MIGKSSISAGVESVVSPSQVATPSFSAFDSTTELWTDYWSRFCTLTKAHSVPDSKKPKVFLTNQSSTVYKMLSNLAAQETPPRDINVHIHSKLVHIELDTATGGNFISEELWSELRKPELQPATLQYQLASKHALPIVSTFMGRDVIMKLKISIDDLLFSKESNMEVKVLSSHLRKVDVYLQESCSKLCNEYAVLFKPELGCLQGFELDVQFKSDAKPVFCKPRYLALSTHQGVSLQNVLPFGISSAPGYFQKIMDDITSDLPGVGVYFDDISVSGPDAESHFQNLKHLLQRLQEKGLRCRRETCQFAQPKVEYLGHILSKQGILKGPKVETRNVNVSCSSCT
uniref:Reverse transcriptase domain-containing protein n=1 Tax=Octopus bimaculoides TaxID=37653 RepID=A0A0L8HEX8_OCTBM